VPPLLVEMLRPHRRTIIAMVSATQMAMALAVPWPLKSVLDNVVGVRRDRTPVIVDILVDSHFKCRILILDVIPMSHVT
jgi:hypothetical protein